MGDKVESIHYAYPLEKAKHFKKVLKNWKRFHKVVWRLSQGASAKDWADAGVGFAATTQTSTLDQKPAKFPSVLVYVDGGLMEEDIFAPDAWTDEGLQEFINSFLPIDS